MGEVIGVALEAETGPVEHFLLDRPGHHARRARQGQPAAASIQPVTCVAVAADGWPGVTAASSGSPLPAGHAQRPLAPRPVIRSAPPASQPTLPARSSMSCAQPAIANTGTPRGPRCMGQQRNIRPDASRFSGRHDEGRGGGCLAKPPACRNRPGHGLNAGSLYSTKPSLRASPLSGRQGSRTARCAPLPRFANAPAPAERSCAYRNWRTSARRSDLEWARSTCPCRPTAAPCACPAANGRRRPRQPCRS